ncbi:ribosome maturation factor RimP [Collinsella sp. AF08-23]|jgi:ribosome maturation factor RimP|uniref:ribosome maturation factor RimP n=1 Tax=Collinsella sp. AF08-23 TaxID=2292211 RepID=UPI000E514E83|nr:ribosome maturation factor RimP [Collinsella sp. AF08-23]RHS40056.1 ribosome maturation factor RimP [Collinsella sp. AF08-23]
MVKSKLEQDIIDALEAQAPLHGIDVVDVEVVGATKAPCIRVRLDKLEGDPINLDEVTAQTAWVSDTVEALDPISGSYTLEVSSPGMKRPLRRPSDFVRFQGEEVELTTTAMEGRRSYKGVIAAADDASVTIQPEGEDAATISYDDVKKCTLKPVYDFKGVKEGK